MTVPNTWMGARVERAANGLRRRHHGRVWEHEAVPRHVEADVVLRVPPAHHLPVRTHAHQQEPQAQAPHPQARQVRQELEHQASLRVPHVTAREDFGLNHNAEVHQSRDREATGADGDELRRVSWVWGGCGLEVGGI